MVLADLHVHSRFSDGQLSIPGLIDLYGQRGFGCIAITDHVCENNTIIGKASKILDLSLTPQNFNSYKSILEAEKQRAWDQYKMLVIPGFELSKNSVSNKRSAHILGLGISEFMWADAEVEVLCREIRSQGGLTVAAHPVFTQKTEKQTFFLWDRKEELAEHFDAWEVASGQVLFKEVMDSGLPMLANSDLHRPQQIESWKTVIDAELHQESIFDAIRQQKVSFKYYTGS